ncbi:zeta toxin family protein [Nocardia abscessus]|uniref:zeta toxin family protein n=1 Tax=Nocardia abscessus TaxID=120957 RepID=UPI001894BF9D|nr:zeta toxin family protein [Nocardia abscessus]MBF6341633.1 zeta toxin family protein [Nocardia abscessus]
MTLPGPAPPRLSEHDHAHIFTTQIIPVLLAEAFPDPQPRAVVLTSHPGSPSAALARTIADTFSARSTASIFGIEDLLLFHPHHQHGLHPADPVIAEQAHQWLIAATKHLANIGASFIIDNTLASRTVAADVITALPGAYRIECAFTAHSLDESLLGALETAQIDYECLRTSDYPGNNRLFERAHSLLDVADWADTAERVAAVSIYHGRGSEPYLRSIRTPSGWRTTISPRDTSHPHSPPLEVSGTSTRQAIETLRARPLSFPQSRDWLRLHASLRARAYPRLRDSLDHARELVRPRLWPTAERPRSPLSAVTFDRFQVVTVADLDTVATMLQSYPRLTIGILNLRPPLPPPPQLPADLVLAHRQLDRLSAEQHNPLSSQQRRTMWTAALTAAGLDERVRVEEVTDLGEINARFPVEQFQLVFAAERADDALDATAARLFAATLRRNATVVDAPMRYHQPDLAGMRRAGTEMWRRYIPRGAWEAFLAVDGPDRVLADPTSMTTQRILHQGPRPDAATDRITAQLDAAVEDLRVEIASLPRRDHGLDPEPTSAGQHPGHSIAVAVADILSIDSRYASEVLLYPAQPPDRAGPDIGPSP